MRTWWWWWREYRRLWRAEGRAIKVWCRARKAYAVAAYAYGADNARPRMDEVDRAYEAYRARADARRRHAGMIP